MTIETILEYLNGVPVRATYGAVGEVLGVRPQVVPRLLGARRPEASWVVNGTTGEPTGYAPDELDPRLPGTRVIRTGDELRRGLESRPAPAAESPAPAAESPAPAAEPAVNGTAGIGMPLDIGDNAKWVIATLVPVFLLVAGLLATQIASLGRSIDARIDTVNERIDELHADLTAQIAEVDARVDDVRTELQGEIDALRSDVRGLVDRQGAAQAAPGRTDPNAAPGPDADDPAAGTDAPAANDEPQTEPPADPDAPAAEPAPPRG